MDDVITIMYPDMIDAIVFWHRFRDIVGDENKPEFVKFAEDNSMALFSMMVADIAGKKAEIEELQTKATQDKSLIETLTKECMQHREGIQGSLSEEYVNKLHKTRERLGITHE